MLRSYIHKVNSMLFQRIRCQILTQSINSQTNTGDVLLMMAKKR